MNTMEVVGIPWRVGCPDYIKPGQVYYIDRESIWINSDGIAYGKVYALSGKYLGDAKLSCFTSV